LHACCGAIIKLNAKGSGSSGLDAVGLPEVLTESFRLLPHDAEIFRACHDSGRTIIYVMWLAYINFHHDPSRRVYTS